MRRKIYVRQEPMFHVMFYISQGEMIICLNNVFFSFIFGEFLGAALNVTKQNWIIMGHFG